MLGSQEAWQLPPTYGPTATCAYYMIALRFNLAILSMLPSSLPSSRHTPTRVNAWYRDVVVRDQKRFGDVLLREL